MKKHRAGMIPAGSAVALMRDWMEHGARTRKDLAETIGVSRWLLDKLLRERDDTYIKFDVVDRFFCRCLGGPHLWRTEPFSQWYTAEVLEPLDDATRGFENFERALVSA
jgi:hypothetical protein